MPFGQRRLARPGRAAAARGRVAAAHASAKHDPRGRKRANALCRMMQSPWRMGAWGGPWRRRAGPSTGLSGAAFEAAGAALAGHADKPACIRPCIRLERQCAAMGGSSPDAG